METDESNAKHQLSPTVREILRSSSLAAFKAGIEPQPSQNLILNGRLKVSQTQQHDPT